MRIHGKRYQQPHQTTAHHLQFEDGIITISGNKPPQKHKVKNGDMILIQREELSKSVNRSIHDIG